MLASMILRKFPAIFLILFATVSLCAQSEGETGFIEVDRDIRLFYQKVGRGTQTVLVPLHLYLFEDFKHLAKGRTFIFYDVRNRGRSTPVADADKISIRHDVEDVEKIRRYFKLDKISLIGESYVGLMVVMYAMQYPQNVERLIQIGPVPLKYGTEYPQEFLPNDEKPVIDPEAQARIDELYKQGAHERNPRDFCEQEWRVSRFRLVGDPANVDKLKSVCHLPNEWAINLRRHFGIHFVGVQKLEIPKAEVAQVSVPVLTIHGTKDRNAVYGAGREWAVLLPNARLLTVKGAAHFPWVDEPKLVFSAIDTFLSGKFPKAAEKLK
jgi:pimeloyl-ACP methyl ester carboxylesterase